VLRGEDGALEARLRESGVQAPIWIQHRHLVVDLRGPAVAFCGIARPQEFFAALKATGVDLLETRVFRDHHRYDGADVEAILALCRSAGVEVCITTEKDAVRLSPKQRAKFTSAVHLEGARLEVSLADEASAIEQLLTLLVRK
jgi:tetraacyldisaccharide 4'-kinase